MTDLRIAEIFGPTVQGEGAVIGRPTVFIRAGGCDYRCSWCDSLHAVKSEYRHEWQKMTSQEIWHKVELLSSSVPLLVSISGGNPAIQDFSTVIEMGKQKGYQFACETQGSIAAPWFNALDMLVLSPKPPSSGHEVNWDMFENCLSQAMYKPNISLKIVIFDDVDFDWAYDVAQKYSNLPLYLQPGNDNVDADSTFDLLQNQQKYEWLINKVNEKKWYNAHVLPQLHVWLWGNKRGV